MKRIAVVIPMIFALLLPGGSVQAVTAQDTDVIRVGTESTFPPFVFREAGGELAGFDIDLVNAVLARLGKKAEFVDIAFDALIPALADGRIDMIAGGLSVTPERLERVDFSKIYFTSSDAVVTRVGEPRPGRMGELRGRTVAVQARTTQDDYLTVGGGILLKRFQRSDEALRSVLAGNADAAFMDHAVVKRFLAEDAGFGKGLRIAFVERLSCDGMAFAARKNDRSFLEEIDRALDELKKEGFLRELEKKWFLR